MLAIAALGIVIGISAGVWLGVGLAQLYARFFSFPFLISTHDPQIYGLAAAVTVAAAVAGALLAVRVAVVLPPAVAMSPPAPADYRARMGAFRRLFALRQTGVMVSRHLFRWPLRTASGTFGVAMAVVILVASLWSFGSINYMIDITFSGSERHDALVAFGAAEPARALFAARQMPGVLAAEPFRAVAARISHRALSRKLSIMGKPETQVLSRRADRSLSSPRQGPAPTAWQDPANPARP